MGKSIIILAFLSSLATADTLLDKCDTALEACNTLQQAQAKELADLKAYVKELEDMAVKGPERPLNGFLSLSYSGLGVGVGGLVAGPLGGLLGGMLGLALGAL